MEYIDVEMIRRDPVLVGGRAVMHEAIRLAKIHRRPILLRGPEPLRFDEPIEIHDTRDLRIVGANPTGTALADFDPLLQYTGDGRGGRPAIEILSCSRIALEGVSIAYTNERFNGTLIGTDRRRDGESVPIGGDTHGLRLERCWLGALASVIRSRPQLEDPWWIPGLYGWSERPRFNEQTGTPPGRPTDAEISNHQRWRPMREIQLPILLDLRGSIGAHIIDTNFWHARTAITRTPIAHMRRTETGEVAVGTSYANNVSIVSCGFAGVDVAIRNPGEAWRVSSCTFSPPYTSEGDAPTACSAVLIDDWWPGATNGFVYEGNWHGDVIDTDPASPIFARRQAASWIALRGWGISVSGNRFAPAGNARNSVAIELIDHNPGGAIHVAGNRMETLSAVKFRARGVTPMSGIAIVGNHHSGSGKPIIGDQAIVSTGHGLLIDGNSFPATIWGNSGSSGSGTPL